MATSSSALFKPYTDNFGSLTLHATFLGDSITATPEKHQERVNLLILIACLLTLVTAAVGIYTADQMVFAQREHAANAYYGGVPIDYD